MGIIFRIKYWILTLLLKQDEYLLIGYNDRAGGASILVEDDERDFLRKVAVEAISNRLSYKNYFLNVVGEYLRKNPEERKQFCKAIYNED